MEINILRLTDSAKLPDRGSAFAAGYDLFADVAEDVTILPHETKMIGTGLAMEIPEGYFGGIFANIIACITAFFVSKWLFILTLIVAFICPNIDGYIISPRVYGKTNNIPTLLTIFAVFAGGVLYGVVGIIIALPLAIILLATYRFYEDDIVDKLDDIKIKK